MKKPIVKIAILCGPGLCGPGNPAVSAKEYGELVVSNGSGKFVTGEISFDHDKMMIDFGNYCEVIFSPSNPLGDAMASIEGTVNAIMKPSKPSEPAQTNAVPNDGAANFTAEKLNSLYNQFIQKHPRP